MKKGNAHSSKNTGFAGCDSDAKSESEEAVIFGVNSKSALKGIRSNKVSFRYIYCSCFMSFDREYIHTIVFIIDT